MAPAKSGGPGIGAGEVFVEGIEKKRLPGFRFFRRVELASGGARMRGSARKSIKISHFGGSTVGDL